MSQSEAWEFLYNNRPKYFTTREVSEAIGIERGNVSKSLKKIHRWPHNHIEKVKGHSKQRAGQTGYFWRYNGPDIRKDG